MKFSLRKLNAIVTILMFIMFILHAVFGSLKMFGVNVDSKVLGWITLSLCLVHVVIGIYLTVQTLIAIHKSGAGYFKENALFWAKRLSGILIIVCVVFHVLAFHSAEDRLPEFTTFRMIMMIFMVISVFLHVLMNVKPLLISFGIRELKPYAGDILLVLTLVVGLSIVAFIIYYMRFNY